MSVNGIGRQYVQLFFAATRLGKGTTQTCGVFGRILLSKAKQIRIYKVGGGPGIEHSTNLRLMSTKPDALFIGSN